jgi:hypothetical protein
MYLDVKQVPSITGQHAVGPTAAAAYRLPATCTLKKKLTACTQYYTPPNITKYSHNVGWLSPTPLKNTGNTMYGELSGNWLNAHEVLVGRT